MNENEINQLTNLRLAAAQTQAGLLQRIADLERQNELLRNAVIIAEKYDVNGLPFWKAYQAAIDGGALEEGDD